MSEQTRPRPRPRPKPKPLAKPAPSTSSQQAGPSTTPIPSSSTAVAPSSPQQIQDEDEMFMRNRTRTSTTWKKLEEINKGRSTRRTSDHDSEGDASPRSRKHKNQTALPRWQRDKNLIRLLSENLTDDDDALQEIENITPNGKHALKRKRPENAGDRRQRSRSRSITPPPALPIHQLQNARNVVRQTLDSAPRPASPTHFDADESTDTIVFDPELARIAQSVASQSQRNPPSQSQSQSYPQLPTAAGGSKTDSLDFVTLRVRWQPHPLNEAGRSELWGFKMNRHDNFRELFEETADSAAILSDNLIMSHNGKRLFPSVTPNTLKIFGEAELVACNKATFDYLRTHPLTSQADPDELSDTEVASRDGSISPTHDPNASDAESQGGDTFKLILRSAITPKDITLTVRPTTKCGAIVKAFLKSAGFADRYPGVGESGGPRKSVGGKGAKGKAGKGVDEKDPRLCIDGEKMNNEDEIGDADLEDGDLVEVVGL